MALNIMDIIPSILTALVLLVAGWWFKNYLPNYFNEKGKLLAQKEDIEEITKKIESVKVEFTRDTEYLKSGLQRLINVEVSHRNEERAALISFYSTCSQWVYSLLDINFSAYNRTNVKDILDKRNLIEKFYSETGIAQAKVKLLVKDDEIISLTAQLWVRILEFKAWVDDKMIELKHILESEIMIAEEGLELLKQGGNVDNARIEKIADKERELKQKKTQLIQDFYSNKISEFKKTVPTDQAFTDKVKKYLTQ